MICSGVVKLQTSGDYLPEQAPKGVVPNVATRWQHRQASVQENPRLDAHPGHRLLSGMDPGQFSVPRNIATATTSAPLSQDTTAVTTC